MRPAPFLLAISLAISLAAAGPAAAAGPPAVPARPVPVTVLADDCFFTSLEKAIGEAKREVLIGTYMFVTRGKPANHADRVAGDLAAAASRGVRVTVVLEQDARDAELTEGNRKTGRLLTQAGVKVLYDDPKVTAHAKLAVIDGRWAFIGSHNLTDAALSHNREVSVLVDSPELAAGLRSYLESVAGAALP